MGGGVGLNWRPLQLRVVLQRGPVDLPCSSADEPFSGGGKICFSLRAVEIDCDRLAPARRVRLVRGGDNWRALLSEELFLTQSRLSACLPTPGPWSFISRRVFRSHFYSSLSMQIPLPVHIYTLRKYL